MGEPNNEVHLILRAYTERAKTARVDLDYKWLKRVKPGFGVLWRLYPKALVDIYTSGSGYTGTCGPEVVSQLRRYTSEFVGSTLLGLAFPCLSVVIFKRYLRARSRILSLTQGNGLLSTGLFSLVGYKVIYSLYLEEAHGIHMTEMDKVYSRVGMEREEVQASYERWLATA